MRYTSRRTARLHQRITMSRLRATSTRCVMNQPAREKTDADATVDESIERDRVILWKTFGLSSSWHYGTSVDAGRPDKRGVILPYPRSSCTAAWSRCGGHPLISARKSTEKYRRVTEAGTVTQTAWENKRPVRGDNRTGLSHKGAWGGWALAPNTAVGEGLPLPHKISRSTLPGRSKRRTIFF